MIFLMMIDNEHFYMIFFDELLMNDHEINMIIHDHSPRDEFHFAGVVCFVAVVFLLAAVTHHG